MEATTHANTVIAYDIPAGPPTVPSAPPVPGPAGLAIESRRSAERFSRRNALARRPPVRAPSQRWPEWRRLFNNGTAAALLNVGAAHATDDASATSQRRSGSFTLCRRSCISHNDQQSVWQAQDAEGATVGWGGAIGDLAMANNTQSLFTCISATGNGVFFPDEARSSTRSARQGRPFPRGAQRPAGLPMPARGIAPRSS